MRLLILYITLFISSSSSVPAQDLARNENDLESFGDCLKKDSSSCIKYKFLSFVDKMLDQKETFTIADGVTVIKTNDAQEKGAPRSLDPASRINNYLNSHSLRFEINGGDIANLITNSARALEDTFDYENDLEEGRGKKKKAAKLLGPLLAALALKAAALVPVALAAIAIIAGKALLIGKIALVLSAIIGLKKLLSQQKHVTYEVVAHPHHSASHTSSHADFGTSGYGGGGGDVGGYGGSSGGGGGHGSGWGRSIKEEAQTLAYSSQKPL